MELVFQIITVKAVLDPLTAEDLFAKYLLHKE